MSKLYDSDFFEWTREQAGLLRRLKSERANTSLDLENLAEEIESLGKSDLRGLMSELRLILEHLLKLEYSPAERPRNGWRKTIQTHRSTAVAILADSPSLRRRIEGQFSQCYGDAREQAAFGLAEDDIRDEVLPATPPYELEQIFDRSWFPTNRHGLE